MSLNDVYNVKQTIKQIQNMNKQKNSTNNEPTFEQLMEKFQFHNDNVQYHAHIAQFLGEEIRTNHAEKAKQSGYFTDAFFENKNKADDEEGNSLPTEEPQTSESASALH